MDEVALCSVISLRTIANEETGTSEHKYNGKESSRISKVRKQADSPYSSPSKSEKKPAKKTGHEMWLGAVQSGLGVSAESRTMNTWVNGRPPHAGPQSSISAFLMNELLQATGRTPSLKSTGRSGASTARVGGSGPAYKDPETYYDEILALKKTIKNLRIDNDVMKAKLIRLEDENIAKSKKIEELLNPDLQSNDLRRTLTSRNADSSEVVLSLRRKIHSLEQVIRNKENDLSKIKSDMKYTTLEELQTENEVYQQEIARLKSIAKDNDLSIRSLVSQEAITDAVRDGKGKKMQTLLEKLSDENRRLTLENQSLRNDLARLSHGNSTEKGVEKDYEDMNRQELLSKIHFLDQKLKLEEKSSASRPLENGDVCEEVDEKCVQLKGTLPQQVQQLREREKELLLQVERLEETIKKLKEDRTHYRKITDDYRQQIEALKKDGCESKSENGEKMKKEIPVESPTEKFPERRASSASLSRKSSLNRTQNKNKHDDFISTGERHNSEIERMENPVQMENLSRIREKQAAMSIQRNWRKRNAKESSTTLVEDRENDDLEEAIIPIQSAWRAHHARKALLASYNRRDSVVPSGLMDSDSSPGTVANAILIQSAFRGHAARKKLLQDKTRYFDDSFARPDDGNVTTGFKNEQSPSISAETSRRLSGVQKMRVKPDVADFVRADEASRDSPQQNSNKTSIKQLKSSSKPWSDATSNVTDKSDDDLPYSSVNTNQKQANNFPRRPAQESDIAEKWARSGSIKKSMKDQEEFQVRLASRHLLTTEAPSSMHKAGDADNDEFIIAPSLQKKLINRQTNITDDLF